MPCRITAMPGRIMACRSCVKITLPVSQQTPKARNHGDYLAFSDVKITGNHLESQDYELHYEAFFIQWRLFHRTNIGLVIRLSHYQKVHTDYWMRNSITASERKGLSSSSLSVRSGTNILWPHSVARDWVKPVARDWKPDRDLLVAEEANPGLHKTLTCHQRLLLLELWQQIIPQHKSWASGLYQE